MNDMSYSSSSEPLLPSNDYPNSRKRSPQHIPLIQPQNENQMNYDGYHSNAIQNSVPNTNAENVYYGGGDGVRERGFTPDFPKRSDVSLSMAEENYPNQHSGQNNYGETYERSRISVDKHNRCCKSRFWCIADVCGIICAIFTWLLMLYSEFVVVRVILMPYFGSIYTVVNMVLFQTFAILAFSSHLKAMLTDPGAVPRGNATKENIQRMGFKEGEVIFKCTKCCSIKPDRAHHCSVCQRCIRKMDHHCPWVNNCVGERNQKYFVLFTLYIATMSFHALFMAINHFIGCIGSDWKECPAFSPPATIIFLLFLMFEGLLFALFTSIMFGTQVSAIWYDETGIEALKKEEATWVRKSRWKSIQAVFGRFSIHWFSPFADIPEPSKSRGYLFSV